ncbi:Pkinase-domain-containing protein [Xylaria curta]|nr:Pkinase-domain-containing protein [Xylaria curta]
MDTDEESQPTQETQPATQTALDPRRIGQQNSGFSDQDVSDIICLLYPMSEAASHEVQRIAASPEYARHTAGRYTADAIDSDLSREDDAREFGRSPRIGDHALVLRLSTPLKDPSLGFTVGRNKSRCDLCFFDDPGRRLSNIHFRIYVNEYGSVLLEDQSTNGTVVDNQLLRMKREPHQVGPPITRRTLESGSTIKIVMMVSECDLTFLVRIPRREGEYEDAYMSNVEPYLHRLNGADDLDKTIGPGPTGHVHLFAPKKGIRLNNQVVKAQSLQRHRHPREWRGSDKYARIGVVGKGAFATVYQVTSKYDGSPYAAKELDKRNFIKNGVVDQKVENEMKIMQKVHHPNIVQYIEHFDWDVHQFIIIMEYVPGGDLGRFIQTNGAIAETHVKTIANQLVDAIGYLHDNKITHRDVKPDNILIQSIEPLIVKLTDFGLSKMIDTEQTFLKTFCGTLLYCAPEVYTEFSSYDDNGRRTNRKSYRPAYKERYDHAVDIWSLGGVLYYTLTGSPPFPVQNGTTYTELLDYIIKTPLNVKPLAQYSVSDYGIHFLIRMIHVRPETRATIRELQSHAWLDQTRSPTEQDLDEDLLIEQNEDHLADRDEAVTFEQRDFDEPSTENENYPTEPINNLPTEQQDFDEDLGQSASQLSLNDQKQSQIMDLGASSLREPEPDISMDSDLEEENHTFRQPLAPRLFGEVSAIGSSGVIPEDRLNLPLSDTSSGETESLGSEVRDSFEESDDFSTPREVIPLSQPDNSRSALLGIGSQSLGGASSILQNLNMESIIQIDSRLASPYVSNVSTSKRKPNTESSDEHDMLNAGSKPSFKRFKSQGDMGNLDDEDGLLASMPQTIKNNTGRQIDYPQHKMIYWDSQDERTWHLNYPEMTHLQYDAFELAAKKRNEEFRSGKTPLWNLAMKYFPPTHGSKKLDEEDDLPQTAPVDFNSQADLNPGIPTSHEHVISSIPSTFVSAYQPRTEVGVLKSASGSLVSDISISLQDPILSWGRDWGNTVVYQRATESRVPKNAFRILLWGGGYTASSSEFRPWDSPRPTTSRLMRASPEPDSYAFYIATKATGGIRINGNPLHSHESKDATAACQHWMKLYHGDYISFWGGSDPRAQGQLIFECSWGGSSITRPADEPPTCVPAPIANQLDRLWPKADKSLRHSRIKEKAQIDQEARMRNMLREQERCRTFEKRRLEALHRFTQRGSRETSPTSTTLERARKAPLVHLFAPPGRFAGDR